MAELARLSRNHLLYFRIEVGRSLSRAFYNDDIELYRATNRRDGSFRAFVAAKGEELSDLGLSEALLRQSLRAFFVVKDLPRALVAQLVYSHVVQLTAVEDENTRRLLAQAIVDNRWTGRALQNAIEAVRNGRWPDADPDQPGLQADEMPPLADSPPAADVSSGDPPPAADEGAAAPPAPKPARVVTEFVRTAKDLEALVGVWGAVPVDKLTKSQTKRMRSAVEALEQQLAQLKARLPA
jgi:hypothetical protein